ncbi:hypothetical protein VH12019_00094 [Vibrio phage VH1_2019]|uniref:Uncharacterized protein n=2 Tax=Schizotequatrovirus KVP40 TaxID=1914019 RepID=A0A6B9SUE2_9CAUD|nr:hypothetical protein VH12019_00094 [Vibrio phage VH1_2019]
MKTRIVRFEDGTGKSLYRIQFKNWYWPFWTFYKRMNEAGSEGIVECETIEGAIECLQCDAQRELYKQREFKEVVGIYDDQIR